MPDQILISICIPAYKGIDFLQRLLDSITIQTFKNFEVVVTDDSPDETVNTLCLKYQNSFRLQYYRNTTTLGTPANWNEAIRKAEGEWIKLMHDDDWFSDEHSLESFAEIIANDRSIAFIFSAYKNVYLNPSRTKNIFASRFWIRKLDKNPAVLFSGNFIGPPSVVLHKKNLDFLYDDRMKWLVDIDFYIRYLSVGRSSYIHKTLVNVGISDRQVTKNAFRNRTIEIPESFLLLEKTGVKILKNIAVFDAWWRLIRNLGIKNEENIRQSGYDGNIPSKITGMIRAQQKIPAQWLKIGPISKICMFACFLFAKGNPGD